MTHTSNVLERVQTSAPTSLYTSVVFETGSKASPEPQRRKSIRRALIPFTAMSHNSRFRHVIVRFIFNISASSWRTEIVHGRASISQPTPYNYSPWTQVHRTSAFSSPGLGLYAKLMSTTVLFDFKAVAKA